MRLSYRDIMAAGWDAGLRSMRKAGRTAWNQDDWDAAAAEVDRLRGRAVPDPGISDRELHGAHQQPDQEPRS